MSKKFKQLTKLINRYGRNVSSKDFESQFYSLYDDESMFDMLNDESKMVNLLLNFQGHTARTRPDIIANTRQDYEIILAILNAYINAERKRRADPLIQQYVNPYINTIITDYMNFRKRSR